MSTENRYANWDTDVLVEQLRFISTGKFLTADDSLKIIAAADRLEALHHAQPVSARVSSEGTSERRITQVSVVQATLYTSAAIVALDANGQLWRLEGTSIWSKDPCAWLPIPSLPALDGRE